MYYRNDKQMDQITHLITALANGQYDNRIRVSKINNELSTISVLLNMLAGRLKETVPRLFPETNLTYLNHVILVIGKDLKINDFNTCAGELFKKEHLQHISSILDNSSIIILREAMNSIDLPNSISLNYRTREDLFITMNSRLTQLQNQNPGTLILSAVKTISRNEWTREELLQNSRGVKSRFSLTKNKVLLDKLYHYLMDNLDTPLRPIPEIAQELKTNSTLLKRGFRHINGTTIAQFHREKRLEKAKDLLRDTDTPLLAIATQCGYKSISHFSRAFKKHFGINPSKVR